MHEIDPTLPKAVMDEYLRRNLLHASSVGAEANSKAALERVAGWKNPPKWLVVALQGIIDRCEKVAPEMAKHRNEIEVYRERPTHTQTVTIGGLQYGGYKIDYDQ